MDSLICMGSILAIAWYLLLGSLAQMPGEAKSGQIPGAVLSRSRHRPAQLCRVYPAAQSWIKVPG